jgi:2-polyprenyl-6-methoxyphenol hydroxylase-like FAD-dependent oxidoreductase
VTLCAVAASRCYTDPAFELNNMTPAQPKNIAIVGGSLGGLLTGVALKHLRKDLNIRILERNPTPLLHDQGAGVVAGRDVQEFFKKHDKTKTPLTVSSHQRLYLDRTGSPNMQSHLHLRHTKAQRPTTTDIRSLTSTSRDRRLCQSRPRLQRQRMSHSTRICLLAPTVLAQLFANSSTRACRGSMQAT